MDRVTGVFETKMQAEEAMDDLRHQGIPDAQLSVVARHDTVATEGTPSTTDHDREEGDTAGERVGKGLAAGAGVGAIFGLAAVLIPGVGPFITAGWLASVIGATAGGIVSGAIVGGTAGAVAGALAKAGYDQEEADFYGNEIERGAVLVAVDISNSQFTAEEVRKTLREHGARFSTREMNRYAA